MANEISAFQRTVKPSRLIVPSIDRSHSRSPGVIVAWFFRGACHYPPLDLPRSRTLTLSTSCARRGTEYSSLRNGSYVSAAA
jgi:hypothetical protein